MGKCSNIAADIPITTNKLEPPNYSQLGLTTFTSISISKLNKYQVWLSYPERSKSCSNADGHRIDTIIGLVRTICILPKEYLQSVLMVSNKTLKGTIHGIRKLEYIWLPSLDGHVGLKTHKNHFTEAIFYKIINTWLSIAKYSKFICKHPENKEIYVRSEYVADILIS